MDLSGPSILHLLQFESRAQHIRFFHDFICLLNVSSNCEIEQKIEIGLKFGRGGTRLKNKKNKEKEVINGDHKIAIKRIKITPPQN